MDFNQIATFVKVVQAGSFSGAARLLGVPVSTVSHHVAMLEKRLGLTLLQRTTRQLHLTQAGKQYYEHAAEGLSHFTDAELSVADAIAEPCGILRIAAPFDIGSNILAIIANAMRKEWPQVKIEFLLEKRCVDLIAEGIDVAIRTGPLENSTLVAKLLGYAKWQLYAGLTYFDKYPHIDLPQQLQHHFCLQFTPIGRESWTLKRGKTSLSVTLDKSMLVDDIGLIKTMVKGGNCIGLLPSYQCQYANEDEKLALVLPDWYVKEDPIYIVYPRQRYIPPKLRVFIELVSRYFNQALDY